MIPPSTLGFLLRPHDDPFGDSPMTKPRLGVRFDGLVALGPPRSVPYPAPGAMRWLVEMAAHYQLMLYPGEAVPGAGARISQWVRGEIFHYFDAEEHPDGARVTAQFMALIDCCDAKPPQLDLDCHALNDDGSWPRSSQLRPPVQ
jgi:hypothetical protein